MSLQSVLVVETWVFQEGGEEEGGGEDEGGGDPGDALKAGGLGSAELASCAGARISTPPSIEIKAVRDPPLRKSRRSQSSIIFFASS